MDRDLIRFLWHNELCRPEWFAFSDGVIRGVRAVGMPSPDNEYLFVGAEFSDSMGGVICGSLLIDCRSSDAQVLDSNVVVHLVAERDKVLLRGANEILSCVVTPSPELMDYRSRMAVDCVTYFTRMEKVQRESIMFRLVSDRIERKGRAILDLQRSTGSWAETFYISFMRTFGMLDKQRDFENLARSIPYTSILRNRSHHYLVEAIFFGQAGFLSVDNPDHYTIELQHEWQMISAETVFVEPIVDWSGSHVRPSSHPSLAIARAVAILCRTPDIMDRVIEAQKVEQLYEIFDVNLSDYWRFHIAPSHQTLAHTGADKSSADRVNHIIINCVAPFLWAFATTYRDEAMVDRSIELLDTIKGEPNNHTRRFGSEGWLMRSSFDSQAIKELCSVYCKGALCSRCPLGTYRIHQFLQEEPQ